MQDKILRKPAVSEVTGLPSSTIYRLIAQGLFPRQIKLSARSSGWKASEIQQWIASRSPNKAGEGA